GRADEVGGVEEAAVGVHLEDDGAGAGGLGVGEGAVHVARERVVDHPLDGDAEYGPLPRHGEADVVSGDVVRGRLGRRSAQEGGGEGEEPERRGQAGWVRLPGTNVPPRPEDSPAATARPTAR